MKSEGLTATTSAKIFIERQQEISQQEMQDKLDILCAALSKDGTDIEKRDHIRAAMKAVVPTYRDPDEVNSKRFLADGAPAGQQ